MVHALLLKTSDNRHFFTREDNLPLLVEFGRTFKAHIYLVKCDSPLLELEELAKSICNTTAAETPSYEVIETKLDPSDLSPGERKQKLNQEVIAFIKKTVLDGGSITADDLVNKMKVDRSTVPGHIVRTRRSLASEGKYIIRERNGQYRLMREGEK